MVSQQQGLNAAFPGVVLALDWLKMTDLVTGYASLTWAWEQRGNSENQPALSMMYPSGHCSEWEAVGLGLSPERMRVLPLSALCTPHPNAIPIGWCLEASPRGGGSKVALLKGNGGYGAQVSSLTGASKPPWEKDCGAEEPLRHSCAGFPPDDGWNKKKGSWALSQHLQP